MVKQRIPETDHGITGVITVAQYDEMQRTFRDRGWTEIKALLDRGIACGSALEIGPGPGYLGLEWLKHTQGTKLTGLDISPDMQTVAFRNAQSYGLTDRAQYRLGSGNRLPFEDASFNAVFTNGSLHEWSNPTETFNEIWRVLRAGGKYYLSDLRRDMIFLMRGFLWLAVKPTAMRSGLISSLNAAYTLTELRQMLSTTRLRNARIGQNAIGLEIWGEKQ
jgi:ubiquinone/menaquinone biosynthesis C-methylase UbiE